MFDLFNWNFDCWPKIIKENVLQKLTNKEKQKKTHRKNVLNVAEYNSDIDLTVDCVA